MRHLVMTSLALVCVAAAVAVHAEAWEVRLGAGPVYGSTFRTNQPDGYGFCAYADLGLTELVSLTAAGGYVHHVIGDGEDYSLSHAGGGVLVNLDVLVVVPYAALRVGWLRRAPDAGEVDAGLGVAFALGFDYLVTDHFTLGFAAEYHGMLTNLADFPAYVGFTGRLGLRLPD